MSREHASSHTDRVRTYVPRTYLFFMLLSFAIAIPQSVAAQTTLFTLLAGARLLLLAVIPVVFGLAVFYFFWGMARYILNAGNETKRDEGKTIMTWGVIVLFVMSSIWGIIWVLQGDTIGGPVPVTIPRVPR